MIETPQNEDERTLVQQLEAMNQCGPFRRDYAYHWAPDFVLQHGRFFRPKQFPSGISQGAPKQCFANAFILAATRGFRYFEGYAFAPTLAFAIMHGWNVDAEGLLIDSTWMNTGTAYLGVEFCVERADDALWNGDGNILDDYQRRFPIFREKWYGEPPNIVWPHSPRLELLRAGRIEDVLAWVDREESNG